MERLHSISYFTTLNICILQLVPSEIFGLKSRCRPVLVSDRNTSLGVGYGSANKKTKHSVGCSKDSFSDAWYPRAQSQRPTWNPLLMLTLDVMTTWLAWTVSSLDIKGPYLSDRRYALLSWSADWAQCISGLRKTKFVLLIWHCKICGVRDLLNSADGGFMSYGTWHTFDSLIVAAVWKEKFVFFLKYRRVWYFKMKALGSFETSGTTKPGTWSYMPKGPIAPLNFVYLCWVMKVIVVY